MHARRIAGLLAAVTTVGAVLMAGPGVAVAAPDSSTAGAGVANSRGWDVFAKSSGVLPAPEQEDAAPAPARASGVNTCPNPQTWTFDPVLGTAPPAGWPASVTQTERSRGHYVYRTCAGDTGNPAGGPGWVWIATGDEQADDPAPDPAVLAQQAYELLAPPVPGIDFRPRHHEGGPDATLVGLWTFFWADQGGLVPLNKRVAAGGNWAEVTATIRQVSFDPGDGSAPLSCPGGGTPYNPDLAYERQVTSCAHRYERASPAPGFTATATVVWSATWAGSGRTGGMLPDVTATATAVVPVQEMQVVNN